MKVLIVPSWYSNSEKPTLGSFFKEQAQALQESGVEVTVAYPEVRNPLMVIKDIKKERKLGLIEGKEGGVFTYRYRKYNIPPRFPMVLELHYYLGMKKIMKKIVKDEKKPDLIHLHSFAPAGYAVQKISKEYDIPYVLTEHATGFSKGIYKPFHIKYLKKVLKDSKKIIAVGSGLKNDLKRYTEKEIDVIPNMVDTTYFQTYKKETNCNKFIFFSLAYLMHKKGFDLLIKAFNNKFKGNENILLYIGGDGTERNNLEKLVKDLGLENQVVFLGALERKEVVRYMNECSAFVLASRFETFGVVFIEALSCGKPIIAPNIDGPNDIVDELNGYTFEVESISDLGEKMNKIYENYEFYNPLKIQRDCLIRYDKKNVAEVLVKAYKQVMKELKL